MLSRAQRRAAAGAVMMLGCLLPRESANAHCRVSGDLVGFYRSAFPHPDPNLVGPINVYLSVGALGSIEHTGLTAEQFLPILRAALSELNTHLHIATLQYAGVHSHDPVNMSGQFDLRELPYGITVGSFECGGAYHPCAPLEGPGLAGCRVFPNDQQMMEAQPGTALVSLSPGACAALASPSWSPAGGASRDPVHVVLHELGHALGLLHSDLATAACQAQGGQEDGDDLPNSAVMWPIVPAYGEGRRLLRDDIEGLEAFWGTSDPSSLWYWHDPEPPADPFAYPDASGCGLAPAHGTSGVPVSVSSAVDGFEADVVVLALTDASRTVRVLEGSSSGFPPIATAEAVEPGETTLHPVAAALGRSGADPVPFVAWLAGETRTSRAVALRWAVRPPGQAWEATSADLGDLPSDIDRRIAAGFDPASGHFLVAAVTGADTAISDPPAEGGRILIITVDTAGNHAATTYLGDTPAYDVGPPTCFAATGLCAIPIMTSELGGPGYAWLEVSIDGDGVATRLGVQAQSTPDGDSGAPDAALWPGASGAAGLRGILGGRRLSSLAYPINGYKWDTGLFDNNGWPLRVGSIKPPGGDTVFPIVARRVSLAAHCGDGIVNCGEECDDANDADGDGCTRCVLDAAPLDSGSGMGGDDSSGRETDGTGGAGGSDGGGGCGCRAQPPVAPPLLIIPGALGAIRRRREARR
jgi:cysteine-rich repeat protein